MSGEQSSLKAFNCRTSDFLCGWNAKCYEEQRINICEEIPSEQEVYSIIYSADGSASCSRTVEPCEIGKYETYYLNLHRDFNDVY
jgi:hypothetical protein